MLSLTPLAETASSLGLKLLDSAISFRFRIKSFLGTPSIFISGSLGPEACNVLIITGLRIERKNAKGSRPEPRPSAALLLQNRPFCYWNVVHPLHWPSSEAQLKGWCLTGMKENDLLPFLATQAPMLTIIILIIIGYKHGKQSQLPRVGVTPESLPKPKLRLGGPGQDPRGRREI